MESWPLLLGPWWKNLSVSRASPVLGSIDGFLELEIQSWIVCDGDVDPEWVESLNSVLDDNRLLTMPSGERIQFGPNVNFLFETHDLSCASPATISRMGMIFLRYSIPLAPVTRHVCSLSSDEDTDVKAVVQSWLAKESEETRSQTEQMINDYFFEAYQWVIKQNEFVIDTTLIGTVLNGLSHLHGVQEKSLFALGLIRGLGGNLNEKSRETFAREVMLSPLICVQSPVSFFSAGLSIDRRTSTRRQ